MPATTATAIATASHGLNARGGGEGGVADAGRACALADDFFPIVVAHFTAGPRGPARHPVFSCLPPDRTTLLSYAFLRPTLQLHACVPGLGGGLPDLGHDLPRHPHRARDDSAAADGGDPLDCRGQPPDRA